MDKMRTKEIGTHGSSDESVVWAERVGEMKKVSQEELLRALEDERADGLEGESVYTCGSPDEGSEAERMAAAAEGPVQRADGTPRGQEGWKRERPLTQSQRAFAQGLIEGKSMRQAYRDAYPNAQAQDQTISAQASKLIKDPRIQRLVQASWEETQESLAEDMAASRRYVMRQLVALSKQAKQEGSRLKALELLGRSAGMFRDQQQEPQQAVSAEALKRELAGHLRLVANGQRMARAESRVNKGQT